MAWLIKHFLMLFEVLLDCFGHASLAMTFRQLADESDEVILFNITQEKIYNFVANLILILLLNQELIN
jgi:hypothetical protein